MALIVYLFVVICNEKLNVFEYNYSCKIHNCMYRTIFIFIKSERNYLCTYVYQIYFVLMIKEQRREYLTRMKTFKRILTQKETNPFKFLKEI